MIIGRNSKNLFTTSDNLFELESEKIGEQTEFRLKKYLLGLSDMRVYEGVSETKVDECF